MKKITVKNIFLTLLLAIIFSLLMPWWSVMIAGFVSAIIFPLSRRAVFLAPFIAVFLYWVVYSFILTSSNDYVLSTKIALLFKLGDNWLLVLVLTGIIGGMAAGVAAVFGRQLHLLVQSQR